MRTTFSEIHLFNDDLFCAWYIFIFNRKGWAESKLAERQKERGRETKHSYKRVAAWAMNLTIGQIFITARERIILGLIKMNIKIIFKNLEGYFSLGAVPFHPAIKLPKYTTVGPKRLFRNIRPGWKCLIGVSFEKRKCFVEHLPRNTGLI
jgi:hypothetical protein